MSIAYFWIFFALLIIGTPVVFALLIGPGVSLVIDGKDDIFFNKLLTTLYNGMYSFPLMAVPFFILAGELMNAGGITRSIVKFSESMIGHFRGGLAQVNILSSILFAGLSGSAVADTSALGKMLIPAMEENGYSRKFAAAVTAASSVIGPIIPPSGIMVLYAFVMNVSVAGLFLAGFIPGLLIGGGLMLLTSYIAKIKNFPVANQRATREQRSNAFLETFPALLTPLLLLGGILSGVYTPTEAAAVAAVYALIASTVIQLKWWRDFIAIPIRAYLFIIPLTLFIFIGFFGLVAFKGYAYLTLAWLVFASVWWKFHLSKTIEPTQLQSHTEDTVSITKDALNATKVTLLRLPTVFRATAVQSGIILFLVGAAVTFGWMVTVSGLAGQAADLIQSLTSNPLVLLLLINLLLFIVGMFLDAGPAILILGPILAPITASIGIDPLHFAIVMCVNVTVGLATPPMGLVLFVASSVANEKIESIVSAIWPFLLVEVVVIFLITFFPSLTMTLPAMMGFAKCPEAASVCQLLVESVGG